MTYITGGSISLAGTTSLVPAGIIQAYGGNSAPTGYLLCDGTAVSRTTFASLFSAIGTLWGVGNGSTTFNVPDLRRRVPVGSGGSGTGTLGNSVGNTGGEENHVLSVGELAAHNHGVTDPGHTHTQNSHNHTQDPHTHTQNSHNHTTLMSTGGTGDGSVSFSGRNASNTSLGTSSVAAVNQNATATNQSATATNNSNTTGITTNNNGSGTGHNTIQPSAVVSYIIKT